MANIMSTFLSEAMAVKCLTYLFQLIKTKETYKTDKYAGKVLP